MKQLSILNAGWTVGLVLLAGCTVDGVELGSGRDLIEKSRGGAAVVGEGDASTAFGQVTAAAEQSSQAPRPEVSQAPRPEVSQTPRPEVSQAPRPEVSQAPVPESSQVPPESSSVVTHISVPPSSLATDSCGGSIPYSPSAGSNTNAKPAPFGSIVVPDAEWQGGVYEFALPPSCGTGPDAVTYPPGYIVCQEYVTCASSPFSTPETCLTILKECYLSTDKAICGNGTVQGNEACDDGNNISDDGCDRGCRFVETGYQCPEAGKPCIGLPVVCGNGQIQGEACDDGNRESGDGCRADCQAVEPGYACPVVGQPCLSIGDSGVTG
jgi:cysteine-rich repeat protein